MQKCKIFNRIKSFVIVSLFAHNEFIITYYLDI